MYDGESVGVVSDSRQQYLASRCPSSNAFTTEYESCRDGRSSE